MPVRKAQAVWHGNIKDGHGQMSFGGGAFEGSYSTGSRFEEAEGTNPEELLGAAHAGCFSMALASALSSGGTPPNHIQTEAQVTIEKIDAGWTVTRVHLTTQADVPGIDPGDFQAAARKAKDNCPISRALGGVDISVEATLLG